MIKARAGNLFMFGLSAENVKRLKEDKTMVIDLAELGGPEGRVVIFYGDTEEIMIQKMQTAGLPVPDRFVKKS